MYRTKLITVRKKMIGKRDKFWGSSGKQSALELRWRRAADCSRSGFQLPETHDRQQWTAVFIGSPATRMTTTGVELSPDICMRPELAVQSQRRRTMVHACWKSWLFSRRLKVLSDSSGARSEGGRLFQVAGPNIAKLRRQEMVMDQKCLSSGTSCMTNKTCRLGQ